MIFGIDVGITGAMVMLGNDGRLVWTSDMPTRKVKKNGKAKTELDIESFAQIIQCMATWNSLSETTYIENLSAMPGQGVTSMFNFGKTYGAILGVLAAEGVTPTLIAPAVWKRYFGLIGTDKDASRQLVLRTFTNTEGAFSLKKHHNRADAALIALYGLHLTKKEQNTDENQI